MREELLGGHIDKLNVKLPGKLLSERAAAFEVEKAEVSRRVRDGLHAGFQVVAEDGLRPVLENAGVLEREQRHGPRIGELLMPRVADL